MRRAATALQRLWHAPLVPPVAHRLYGRVLHAMVGWYARYHERRRTPAGVYTIPGWGCRMWLPISWGKTVAQRRFGLFEPWTTETLRRVIRPGMRVVELGACYGEFTILLSRLVGPQGRVYAFEPFPKCFEIAQRNIGLNGLTNVELFNQAAAPASVKEVRFDAHARHGYGSLHQISGLDYSARAGRIDERRAETIPVTCVSLSEFLGASGLVMDALVMDIEGCEIEVLEDLRPVLQGAGRRPLVYVELHEPYYRPGQRERLEALFRDAGYAIMTVQTHWLCTPPDAGALPATPAQRDQLARSEP